MEIDIDNDSTLISVQEINKMLEFSNRKSSNCTNDDIR